MCVLISPAASRVAFATPDDEVEAALHCRREVRSQLGVKWYDAIENDGFDPPRVLSRIRLRQARAERKAGDRPALDTERLAHGFEVLGRRGIGVRGQVCLTSQPAPARAHVVGGKERAEEVVAVEECATERARATGSTLVEEHQVTPIAQRLAPLEVLRHERPRYTWPALDQHQRFPVWRGSSREQHDNVDSETPATRVEWRL